MAEWLMKHLRTALLCLAVTSCATTNAVTEETAFHEKDADAVVIVGIKLLERRWPNYNLSFLGYDPAEDRGFQSGSSAFQPYYSDGRPAGAVAVNGYDYFLFKVPPGHYVLIASGYGYSRREGLTVVAGFGGRAAMNMKVYCNLYGRTAMDVASTPVSSLRTPKFTLNPGAIQYIGDFELDGFANPRRHTRNRRGAEQALRAYPRVVGPLVDIDFIRPYDVNLPLEALQKC